MPKKLNKIIQWSQEKTKNVSLSRFSYQLIIKKHRQETFVWSLFIFKVEVDETRDLCALACLLSN